MTLIGVKDPSLSELPLSFDSKGQGPIVKTAGVVLLICVLPFPDHASQVLKDHLVPVKNLMVVEETMSSPGTSLTSLCLCCPP